MYLFLNQLKIENMSKVIVTITTFLLSLMAFSQVSENRSVGNFSKLKASHGIEVFYTISTTNSIRVETDDNERLKMVKTEIENGTLKVFVETKDNKNYSSKSSKGYNIDGVNFKVLKVYISGPSLTSYKASSSADISIEGENETSSVSIDVSSSGSISGKFSADKFMLDASSSGDFNGTVQSNNVAIETSSSSDVVISGKTETLDIKSSSSSSCVAKDLLANNVIVSASSSADVKVFASKVLNAKASSSADIVYYGNPTQLTEDESSSGSIKGK